MIDPADIQQYQLLVTNRAEATIDDLLQGCKELQVLCLNNTDDVWSVKLLEQLLMAYYEQSYPTTFGGIFEPLTKVIGFTHCHYLHPEKFDAFDHNMFWPKFNILTNWIEDMPDALQPRDIGEMMHVLHLICYIQNRYYDKHVAALAFQNKDQMIGGEFAVFYDKLVIVWDDDDSVRAYTPGAQHVLAYNACDVIVHTRNNFPSLSENKEIFVDHLNSWGNQALKEIMMTEVSLPDLRQYFKQNTTTFSIGPIREEIKNEYSNIHFTRGLLYNQEVLGTDRPTTINVYQDYLNEYIAQPDIFDQVFFISNAQTNFHDYAFAPFYEQLRPLLQQRYGFFHDYSPDRGLDLFAPFSIVDFIVQTVNQNPQQRILIAIGLHGQNDGSADYTGGSFMREDFDRLFNLASTYPNVQLFIMSCWSAKKTETLLGNVIMSSSEQVSYITYMNYFLEMFTNGNSLYLSHIYAMTKYHKSILPTSYRNTQGTSIQICPLSSGRPQKPV